MRSHIKSKISIYTCEINNQYENIFLRKCILTSL